MRQVILDTETTGLDPKQGHRIIEIGCVEMIDRRLTGRDFHHYLNPNREIDPGAVEVHGITPEFLQDKPEFHQICPELTEYLRGAEIIIHNADFDVGFLSHEYRLCQQPFSMIVESCQITDTLALARKLHPGQRNSLDALCKRYQVNHFDREQHGALLDSTILAHVYLAMTGGQCHLFPEIEDGSARPVVRKAKKKQVKATRSMPITVSAQERSAHQSFCDYIESHSEARPLWVSLERES